MSFEMCWSAMFITLDLKDRFVGKAAAQDIGLSE